MPTAWWNTYGARQVVAQLRINAWRYACPTCGTHPGSRTRQVDLSERAGFDQPFRYGQWERSEHVISCELFESLYQDLSRKKTPKPDPTPVVITPESDPVRIQPRRNGLSRSSKIRTVGDTTSEPA